MFNYIVGTWCMWINVSKFVVRMVFDVAGLSGLLFEFRMLP